MKKIIYVFLTIFSFSLFAGQSEYITEVKSVKELQAIISSSNTPVFVDCYSNSCPPCRRLSPLYDKYAEELSSKGKFVKVNLSRVHETVAAYEIQGMPTLLVFDKKGNLESKEVGFPKIRNYFETLKK